GRENLLMTVHKQTGDTIVEVLICITIVGSILTGAFLSAQRNQAATQRSQERVEALKLAEGDVERLRNLAANDSASILFTNPATGYCFDKQGTPHLLNGSLPALESDQFNNTVYRFGGGGQAAPDSCPRQPSGGVWYYPSIIRVDPNT